MSMVDNTSGDDVNQNVLLASHHQPRKASALKSSMKANKVARDTNCVDNFGDIEI
jgi:hypothetical protein